MATDYQLTLQDYLAMFKRRAGLVAAVFTSIFLIAIVVAAVMPPIYQSAGKILIESQRIPTDLVPTATTSVVEERIAVIRQRVMTRANLLEIIEKYDLYAGATTVSEKLDAFREQFGIEFISVRSGRSRSTIALELYYQHGRADTSYRVANDVITLFLEENIRARTEQANETTDFLAQEADKLEQELAKLEALLAEYKEKNRNALPEHLNMRMSMLSRTEAQLKEIERQRRAASEELRFLDIELGAVENGLAMSSSAKGLSMAQQLRQMKAEYASLLTRYNESHPSVKELARKIEVIEQSVGDESSSRDRIGASPELARVQAKVASVNSRIGSLDAQAASLRNKLQSYESQIVQTPQVERGMVSLMRDYENAQKKYREIRDKQMNAQISETMEEENKSERFTLLEPPVKPETPFKPDRMKIVLLGLMAAVGGALGLAFLLEMMNPRIRGAGVLGAIAHQRPLVVVPYIPTKDEQGRKKRNMNFIVAGVVVGVIVALLVLHFAYMPLDMLWYKLIARI